jgi:hypothetical protein
MATRQPNDADRRVETGNSGLTESQSPYRAAQQTAAPDPSMPGGVRPMNNRQQEDRAASNHPPSGRNDDESHALRAGQDGSTQRKSPHEREPSTRDAGRDDRRSGSESGKD